VLNHRPEPVTVRLPLTGTELLGNRPWAAEETLPAYGVAIVQEAAEAR
jgi:hypothetical protein